MVRHAKDLLTGYARLKARYRHVLVPLQSDAKRYHGGIHGLAGRALRPREIEGLINAGRSSVNATLQRLEHCRLAVRTDVPCPSGTKAFEWRAVV